MPRSEGRRPAKVGLDGVHAIGDLIEYKADFRAPRRAGYVEEVGPHDIRVRDAKSGRLVALQPGKKGRIWKLHGERLVAVQAELPAPSAPRSAPPAEPAPPLRIVRTGPAALRPVPRMVPQAPAPAFRRFVRGFLCLSCETPGRAVDAHHAGPRGVGQKSADLLCVPLCRLCHGAYHDHGHFPGRSAEDTELLILGAHVALLLEWNATLQGLLVPLQPLDASSEDEAFIAGLEVVHALVQ